MEYQLLWSLFHATEWTVHKDRDGITAILEPTGGADLEYRFGQDRRVEQVKARTTGKPWSLDEVLGKVLPSLYSHVDPSIRTAYVFVTEGPMGDWEAAYRFFQNLHLRDVDYPDGIALALDSRRAFAVGRRRFTERRLFNHAVRLVVGKRATSEEQFRVWQLLRDFHFEGERDHAALVLKVHRALMNHGVALGALEHKRQELIGDLLGRAGKGSVRLDAARFFREHGLTDVSLVRWVDIHARARRYLLEDCLTVFGYSRDLDVREDGGASSIFVAGPAAMDADIPTAREVVGTSSAILLAGDSGIGKSWQLYRLAHDLAKADQLTLLIRAAGDVSSDLQVAAATFCREIWGTASLHSLRDVAILVRRELPRLRDPWLTLLIDGVEDEPHARSLLEYPWRELGIRVALTSRKSFAGPLGTQVVAVQPFTMAELSAYLKKRLGVPWLDDLPEYLWSQMKVPLFARLFCDRQGEGVTWRPASEYQVFEQAWLQQTANARLAASAVAHLAGRLAQDRVYPWPMAALRTAGLRDAEIEPLLRSGFLRLTSNGRAVEIWHDRLLNWAVAEGLVSALRGGDATIDTVIARALREEELPPAIRRRLGYVAMDTLWLLATPEFELDEPVRRFVAAFAAQDRHTFRRNLPTLGSRIAPHLFALLEGSDAEDEE